MHAEFAITARRAFDSRPSRHDVARKSWRILYPRAYLRLLRDFYRDPLAWVGLVVAMLVLGYLGGAVMFVLHAEILGELGPAINPYEHWLLDSTLGFVGLMPMAAVILPGAAYFAWAGGQMRTGVYASIGGLFFALATAPGPIAHDMLVGRGTWLANHVADWLGSTLPAASTSVGDMSAMPGMAEDNISQVLSIGSQVAVGIPTYITLVWLSLVAMRALLWSGRGVTTYVRRTRRRPLHALAD